MIVRFLVWTLSGKLGVINELGCCRKVTFSIFLRLLCILLSSISVNRF